MDVVSRSEWGAGRARARDRVGAGERRAVMVHYSTGQELGRADTAAWVRQIQRYHQEVKGWADIGYHFLVDASGRIYEGRGWDYAGAHCPDWNTTAWGVCFLGNDDPGSTDAPPAALASIRWLYDQACQRAGRQLAQLGHRDGRDTACPGDELYAWVRGGMLAAHPSAPGGRPPRAAGTGARARPPEAPRFPLPAGSYYGPRSGPRASVSGFLQAPGHPWRRGLAAWQSRMAARGWRVGAPDGLYGERTAAVVRAFQAEKRLGVDGRIGPRTWAAAWTAEVTR